MTGYAWWLPLAVGPPPEAESLRDEKTSMLYFSEPLIIGPFLFLLMSSVAGGGWEGVIDVCTA